MRAKKVCFGEGEYTKCRGSGCCALVVICTKGARFYVSCATREFVQNGA
jgi:hypothetical protein